MTEIPEEASVHITVSGWDLTRDEAEALLDRVAAAAHDLDQQVCCSAVFASKACDLTSTGGIKGWEIGAERGAR